MTAYIEHLREGEEFVHRDPPARVALLDLLVAKASGLALLRDPLREVRLALDRSFPVRPRHHPSFLYGMKSSCVGLR